jgi:cell division protein FtsL
MFGFDYYEVLLYNVAIIIATLSVELLFVFIYTKKYILFDDATFISYGIETLKEITTDNYQQNKDQCDFSRPPPK